MRKTSDFNLLRWFAILSPIAIGLIALCNGWLISTFLSNHLFQREASISRDFVQSILETDGALRHLSHPDDPESARRFAASVAHLSNMHDVVRTNVYGANRVVLWSTDPALVGRQFKDNEELDEALQGKQVVEAGDIASRRGKDKEEHVGLDQAVRFFVESYIPLIDPQTNAVVGAVELYKAPVALTRAIEEGRVQVALAALGSALALYACLYGLIRHADRIIRKQRAMITEVETLAVVGELASSVAHNIRNPLSSIRSSAEMLLAFPQEDGTEYAQEIVREVDRISSRITELLRLAGNGEQRIEQIDLAALVRECIADHQAAFLSRGLSLRLEPIRGDFRVMADKALLGQVFISLLSNASEAMGEKGECVVALADADPGRIRVDIRDQGTGVDPANAQNIFRPFFTTKPKGLGLGLPLAKRIVERFGGSLAFASRVNVGTTVSVTFPRA